MARVGGGDGGLLNLGSLGDVGHVVHEVDDALAVGGGDGDGADDAAVLALEGFESLEVIAVLLVALGDAEHDGQLCVLQVIPAALAADGEAVGRILGGGDNHAALDSAPAVVHRGDGSRDGDLAGGLLGIVVADGGAVGNLAHAVDGAGAVEHALGKAGLAVVAVADQADVANVFRFVAHVLLPLC